MGARNGRRPSNLLEYYQFIDKSYLQQLGFPAQLKSLSLFAFYYKSIVDEHEVLCLYL